MKFFFCTPLFFLVAFTVIFSSCSTLSSDSKENNKTDSIQNVRNILLSYWANPQYITDDFGEQLTGTSAELEMYDLREDRIYFSIRKDLMDSTTLSRLTLESDSVLFGQDEGRFIRLGGYRLYKSGHLFFSIPAHSFRVPEKFTLIVPFSKYSYNISGNELVDFVENRTIYGGKMSFISKQLTVNQWVSANHGAMVATKGESSLLRLTDKITQGLAKKEEKIQALLDFVTREIPYSEKERNARREIMKRPNEVLMTRTSDCSGKTILFASLLEQLGADYRLAYLNNHICVLVNGNFSKENDLNVSLNDTTYFMAETTAKGFIIGESQLQKAPNLQKEIEFIQKPEKNGYILEYPSGEPVKFK
ncbi:MAG: transglutaminase-like domain-containing protein [Bacteroidia bacterium]|nr:transglutaminase-like domain-containing protein [Bacteroidia bacterium]